MTVAETEWVLDRIKAEWPGGYPASGVWRLNENEPEILDGPRAGERVKSVDLSNAAVIRATGANQQRTPVGTEFRYLVETVVDVTVESVHQQRHGTVASGSEFAELSLAAKAAINRAREYPDPDFPASHPQPPEYHTALVEDATDALAAPNQSGYYRQDFSVRLQGLEPTVAES